LIWFEKYIVNNTRNSILFLASISLIFFVGLGKIHLFDWDEINFAESAREMMETGDYLRVQINYNPFWEKPPFFFWLQVGAMKVFGINEFAARFPNAVFGFIYLITFYFIGKKHFSAKFGMIWALLFFGSLLPHLYFKSGIIDPVFNYFIFTSIYFLMLVIGKSSSETNTSKYALISGVLSGLSVLTKGPVGFLLLGLTLLIYLILKKFKPFPSLKHILLFFIGLVSMISIWVSMEVFQNGWSIIEQFIAYQAELFNADVAGHAQPFYYHFVVVGLFCFPISIIALPNLFLKKISSEYDFHTWMKILFWVVMVLFSITTTKIIHYSSMTYIPLAFIATYVIYNLDLSKENIKRYVHISLISISVLLGVVFTVFPLLLANKEILIPYINDPFAVESMNIDLGLSGYEFLIGIFLLMGSLFSIRFLKRNEVVKSALSFAATMGITLLFVLYFIVYKVEKITQGPAIEFYSNHAKDDVYIETLGKSYAPYFYGAIQESSTINSYKQEWTQGGVFNRNLYLAWLIQGDVDKDVYFAAKSTNRSLDDYSNFKLLYTKGGFRFYKRIQ